MKDSSLKKFERFFSIALACMIPVSIGLLLVWFLTPDHKEEKDSEEPKVQIINKATPAPVQKLEFKPDKCTLNQPLPEVSFVKENGDALTLKSMSGKVVVLTFWASWCPHCNKELEQSSQIQSMLSKYPEVEFWLVDKLDEPKETKEKALSYLKENKIPFQTVFDENLQVYKQLGIKIVPTTLVIDKQGVLRAWHTGEGLNAGVLEAMLQYALNRGSDGVLDFITRHLTNAEGGIKTNYLQRTGVTPGGTDVLSESQGLIMEYAVTKKDKALFDRSFNYILDKMHKDPLPAWVATQQGPSRVNALLDDLRIYRSLSYADTLWGGYSSRLENYEKALYRYNTEKQFLVNNYDFQYRKKSKQFKLCFADFEALQLLAAKNPSWEKVRQNSLDLVEKGSIKGDFPLYYSTYDYTKKEYLQEDINMAEGMVTLLHLARIHRLPQKTVDWLKAAVDGEGIFAKYRTDGTVIEGYRYESTAIYGLVSLIAAAVQDEELANKALLRMEAMRIFDTANPLNGAFGNPDGTGIYSFDQCMALLAYSRAEEDGR